MPVFFPPRWTAAEFSGIPLRTGKLDYGEIISSLTALTSATDAKPTGGYAAIQPVRSRRVAVLDHTASLGGGEVALLHMVCAMDPTRFVPVVILFSDGPLRARLEQAGIETILFPLSAHIVDTRKDALGGGTLLRLRDALLAVVFIWKLSRELKRIHVDIVHTNSLKADILGGFAGRLAGIPVLWHVRDRIADDYLPSSVAKVFRWLARVLPAKVVANSYATLETLRRGGETDNSRIDQAGFCVVHDGTHVPPMNAQRTDSMLTAGLVGRISPWKGQHIFLRAISLIRDRFPQARFQIIGAALFSEAEYEKEIRTLCTCLGLDSIVDFMGFREDVADLVSRMDLLVHASTTGEPFGQVILEGMAAGKAVIATRGGGVPEFVDDPNTGILVPMGNVQAMADAIARFLSDADLRTQTGLRARQHVMDGFTIAHTATKIQDVYDSMLGARNLKKAVR